MRFRRAVVAFASVLVSLGVAGGSATGAVAPAGAPMANPAAQTVIRTVDDPIAMAPGQLANKFSRRCLVVPRGNTNDGVGLTQSTCDAGFQDQRWHFAQNGNHFHIRNDLTEKCVVIARGNTADGVQATQSACANFDDQLWTIQHRYDNGEYYGTRFVAKHSGKCLVAPARNNWDGGPVTQSACVLHYPDQWWYQP